MGYAVKQDDSKAKYFNDNDEEIPLETVVAKMDANVKEFVDRNFGRDRFEFYPVFMEYCKEHKKKFGEEFKF